MAGFAIRKKSTTFVEQIKNCITALFKQVMGTKRMNGKHPKSCIIANPIYDTVFKKLMEHERIARFFLGTLLGENILSVEVSPQEFTYKRPPPKKGKASGNLIGYSIFRIDFMAVLETKEGERKKILIEVQKSWDETDVERFRNYLGEQYKRVDRVEGEEAALPITTIYVLGGRLAEIESPCIKVERRYRDLYQGNLIEKKAPFVEKLTHDCYVIQAKRITDQRYGTKLNELLSLFEQAHFVEAGSEISKEYTYSSDDEDILFIASMLKEMVADPREREEIAKEEEAQRVMALFGRTNRKQEKALEEKEKVIGEQKTVIEEQETVIGEQKSVIGEQAKALEEQARQIAELKRLIDTK
jgi:hypothetical protein